MRSSIMIVIDDSRGVNNVHSNLKIL